MALAVRRFIYGDAAMIQTTQSFYESYWFVVLSQFLVVESLYAPGSNSAYGGGLLAVLALSVYSISIAFCAAVAQRSRKGSGIRQGHLLRALAYSYVGPWMVYFVFVVLWSADRISLWDIGSTQYEYWYSYSSYSYVAQSQGWVGLRGFAWACYFYWGAYWWVMFSWLTLWWLFALKSGFRLRGWWQIWPLGIILGIVATAFVAFFIESMLVY